MAAYKDRVKQDLDRWIAAGLVASEHRDAILATLPQSRRMDAAAALAWVGALLLGIAVIAAIAANWEALPKLGRFVIVLAAFLLTAAGAAWAAHKERTLVGNVLLTVAALIFAAAIGLTGQIFDIAGDPRVALHGASLAAFALALAGRSTGAACAALALAALGDLIGRSWFSGLDAEAPWMLFAAPLGVFLALRWSSSLLAHASALGIVYCFAWFAGRADESAGVFLFIAILLAGMAAAARWLRARTHAFATVFYGWFAAAALLFFAVAGYLPWFGAESGGGGIAHRIVWLGLSGGVIALGRFDRHALVTAAGVLSLIAAIAALLGDLGLDLMAAAGVFLICALAALVAGLVLRQRKAGAS